MRSYRSLFRTPEFTPFLLSSAASAAAGTIGALALATLVFRATGSPLLSAVSMFGPQLAQLLGGAFLLSAADRLPPRAILSGLALAFALGTAVLALPGLPVRGSSPSCSRRAWRRRRAAGCAAACCGPRAPAA
ncbi:hypothetical protein ACFV4N_01475 [Actinosynnema sp. NPDC059797]